MVLRVIGLTGGICAGKSSISKAVSESAALAERHVDVVVIDADKVGWEVYKRGTDCYNKLVEYFGETVLNNETKEIDRRALGGIVFSDKEKMLALQNIVWPEMHASMSSTINDIRRRVSESGSLMLVLLEAAVMVEAQWHSMCDCLWVVLLSREEAVRRLMERNGFSLEDATHRVNTQITDEERTKFASRLIDGSRSQGEVEAEVSRLLKEDFLDRLN